MQPSSLFGPPAGSEPPPPGPEADVGIDVHGASVSPGISAPLAEEVAGEIKNRLAGIHAVLQLVARQMSAGDPERDLVEAAAADVREIDETAAGLMRLARPPLLQRQPTDLRSFLSDIALPWSLAGLESGHRVRVEAPEELVLALDQKRIGKALGELVRRALQALDGPGEILLTARLDEQGIEVEVRDDRPLGERTASRFRNDLRPGACGLGLLIARLDIEAHGGTLSIDTCPCGGCVHVRLPHRAA